MYYKQSSCSRNILFNREHYSNGSLKKRKYACRLSRRTFQTFELICLHERYRFSIQLKADIRIRTRGTDSTNDTPQRKHRRAKYRLWTKQRALLSIFESSMSRNHSTSCPNSVPKDSANKIYNIETIESLTERKD